MWGGGSGHTEGPSPVPDPVLASEGCAPCSLPRAARGLLLASER